MEIDSIKRFIEENNIENVRAIKLVKQYRERSGSNISAIMFGKALQKLSHLISKRRTNKGAFYDNTHPSLRKEYNNKRTCFVRSI